jgi:hypothetical protein
MVIYPMYIHPFNISFSVAFCAHYNILPFIDTYSADAGAPCSNKLAIAGSDTYGENFQSFSPITA